MNSFNPQSRLKLSLNRKHTMPLRISILAVIPHSLTSTSELRRAQKPAGVLAVADGEVVGILVILGHLVA